MLPLKAEPFLHVTGQALPFGRHLESLRRKLSLRVGLMKQLAKSSKGALKKCYAQLSLALVYSTAEYYDLHGVITTTLDSSKTPLVTYYA